MIQVDRYPWMLSLQTGSTHRCGAILIASKETVLVNLKRETGENNPLLGLLRMVTSMLSLLDTVFMIRRPKH